MEHLKLHHVNELIYELIALDAYILNKQFRKF